MAKRLTALLLPILLAMATPAYAYCPSQPDGPDSSYVQNGQSRALCLNKQLTDSSSDLNDNARWNNLVTSVQRGEIQRRFDTLPRVDGFRR